MKAEDFSRNVYDNCMFMKKLKSEIYNLINLLLFVNDMLILTTSQSDVRICKNQMTFTFKMEYLDKSKNTLGMNI